MNPHKPILDAALAELAAWRHHPPAGDATTERAYDVIDGYLHEAAEITDEPTFYDYLSSINRFVCDEGPLSEDFIPSFRRLFLRLHYARTA